MRLRDVYGISMNIAMDLYLSLGYNEAWIRWPQGPKPEYLDKLPISIKRESEGGPWVVAFDPESIGGTHWVEFESQVKSVAIAKLTSIKNLKQFSRDHKYQYTGLQRAKWGNGVTDTIMDMVGACPDVVFKRPRGKGMVFFQWPERGYSPLEKDDPVLGVESSSHTQEQPITP